MDVLAFLQDLSKNIPVNLEIGIESIYEKTLTWMNRCHSMKDTYQALSLLEKYSFDVTAHLILGSPTETREEMLAMTREINRWNLQFLKLHHLQVLKESPLGKIYQKNPFHLFFYEEYLDIITEFIARIKPDIIFQRLFAEAPRQYLIAPVWGKRTPEIVMDIQKTMREKNLWQADKR